MANHRCCYVPGGSYFFTVVTERRAPILANNTVRNWLCTEDDSCLPATMAVRGRCAGVVAGSSARHLDMSARVMATLEEFAPSLEVYSIDEAFLDLTGVYHCHQDPIAYGQCIKKAVFRATGIPVCVGMGPDQDPGQSATRAYPGTIQRRRGPHGDGVERHRLPGTGSNRPGQAANRLLA